MSWNGSQGKESRNNENTVVRLRFTKQVVIVVSLVIIIFTILVALFVNKTTSQGEGSNESFNSQTTKGIETVKPSTSRTFQQDDGVKIHSKRKPFRYWESESTNGFTEAMIAKWENERRPRRDAVKSERQKPTYAIFEHRSENAIAAILTLPLGEGLLGSPVTKGMERDFLKSCEEPIVISPDDDESIRELKEAMIETKIEIQQRIKAGEKFEDIINESCAESRKLAQTVSLVNSELRKLRRRKASAEELNDFIEASNKFLANKGIAPLRVGTLLKHQIKSHIKNEIDKKGTDK